MSIESALLTKVLETGNFRVVLSQKITRFSFRSITNQIVYSYIQDHFLKPETRGQVPSKETVLQLFPEFEPEYSDTPLETLCTEVRETRLQERLMTSLIDIQSLAEVQPKKALDRLRKTVFSLAREMEVSELGSLADLEDVKEDYYRAKAGEGVVGIPFPWNGLTKESGGMMPEELVVIFGRNKSMKSWLLMFLAVHGFISGYKVLFVSAELGMRMVKRRMAAIVSGVEYEKFRLGNLSPREEDDVFFILDTVLGDVEESLEDNDLIILPTEEHGTDYISQKIAEVRPDLVCIDSVYMLAGPQWKDQSELVKSVKTMAKDHKVPIVVTTQANRSKDKEDKTSRLAFADTYAQIADYLLHIEKLLTFHKGDSSQRLLPSIFAEVVAAREFQMEGFRLDINPAVYCREVEVYKTADQLIEAKNTARTEAKDISAASTLITDAGWTEAQ